MADSVHGNSKGLWGKWNAIPLYQRILVAMVLGGLLGYYFNTTGHIGQAKHIGDVAKLVLNLLTALATPLIFFAILNGVGTTEIKGRQGGRLIFLLLCNTFFAIVVGLLITNLMQPGKHWDLPNESQVTAGHEKKIQAAEETSLWGQITRLFPNSLLRPIVEGDIIGMAVLALLLAFAFKAFKANQLENGRTQYKPIEDGIHAIFHTIMGALHIVIGFIPVAVFAVVASAMGVQGFKAFKGLIWFIPVVLIGLLVQNTYYLTWIAVASRWRLREWLRGVVNPATTAFSTASSTGTMPVTLEALDRMGVSRSSASLGAAVGTNFNNDGTALYEAAAAIFAAQALGMELPLGKQLIIVFTSVIASAGAAGIPEAGLITMTLVFRSVGLPVWLPLALLPVDWFLDRCRTATNVMGDMTVSTLLDGFRWEKQVDEGGFEEAAGIDDPQPVPAGETA